MNKLISKIVMPAFVFMTVISFEAAGQSEFEKKMFTGINGNLPYNILMPMDFSGKNSQTPDSLYPLVIFFHGAGERGFDNEVQFIHIKKLFENVENQQKFKAFVVAPQCPANQQWVNLDWTKSSHKMPEKSSAVMEDVVGLINWLQKNYPVDTTRIYVTGLSMGGYGTWDIICRYPEKFAAAVPICGGGDASKAVLLKSIPVWVFHGANDKVVPVVNSRKMVAAMRKKGANPVYTEYTNTGHDCWTRTFAEKGLLEWIFNQKRQ